MVTLRVIFHIAVFLKNKKKTLKVSGFYCNGICLIGSFYDWHRYSGCPANIAPSISLRFNVSRFNSVKQQHAHSSRSTWILHQSTVAIFLFLSINKADGLTSFRSRTRTIQLDASSTPLVTFLFTDLALL